MPYRDAATKAGLHDPPATPIGRLREAGRLFVNEAALIIFESVATGLTLTLGAQLLRPIETLTAFPGFRLLADRVSEPTWAVMCIAVGLLPVAGLLLGRLELRWLALCLEVGLYSVMTLDFYNGSPAGLIWIFTLWIALGCAAGAVRVSGRAFGGPLRRLQLWHVRRQVDKQGERIERRLHRRSL